jgi:hypothetical protein
MIPVIQTEELPRLAFSPPLPQSEESIIRKKPYFVKRCCEKSNKAGWLALPMPRSCRPIEALWGTDARPVYQLTA